MTDKKMLDAIDHAAERMAQEMSPADIKEAVAACVINLRDCEDDFTTLMLEIEHDGDTSETREDVVSYGRMAIERMRTCTCLLHEVLEDLDG